MKSLIGVEIELAYNSLVIDFQKGVYHGGLPILPHWKVEEDGSLHSGGDYDQTAEFVSKPFPSRLAFIKGLEEFYNYFSKNGKMELDKVIAFNNSTGSHIHFSIDGYLFAEKCVFRAFERTREYFMKRILKSKIESRQQIVERYNRHYSECLDEGEWEERETPRNRYLEFNFVSEASGRGIEWRSPNMTGIKTWKEFFLFWNIVCDSLEYFAECATHYSQTGIMDMISRNEIRMIERECETCNSAQQILLCKVAPKQHSRMKTNLEEPQEESVVIQVMANEEVETCVI